MAFSPDLAFAFGLPTSAAADLRLSSPVSLASLPSAPRFSPPAAVQCSPSLLAAALGAALVAKSRRRRAPRASEGTAQLEQFRRKKLLGPDDDGIDRHDWSKDMPDTKDLEKMVDGEKWILVKMGKVHRWMKESEVGIYRYTERGYESKDPEGNWVSNAQMPQDTSHLSDEQRERLIKELRGEIKSSLADGDESKPFVPMANVPPLEKWPFYEVTITDELKITPELLKDYKELEMNKEIGRAFFLATRWKQANEARRHLGYSVNDDIQDIAGMNGAVLALKALVEQLKRIARFRKIKDGERKPSDANRLRELKCDGILGTSKGSAMALWLYNPAKKRISVDICMGDDCMDQGPYAEEVMLRVLASKGAELGAEKIWCRTRRTESGKVFVPKPLRNLNFTKVPLDQQDEEDWETYNYLVVKQEYTESVPGLYLWMSTRDLSDYLQHANTWCYEMGATDINEVADEKKELAKYLKEKCGMLPEELDRLLQY